MIQLTYQAQIEQTENLALIITKLDELGSHVTDAEKQYLQTAFAQEHKVIHLNRLSQQVFVVYLSQESREGKENYQIHEAYRQAGFELFNQVKSLKLKDLQLFSNTLKEELISFAEGFALSAYKFDKYLSKKAELYPEVVKIAGERLGEENVTELANLVEANFLTRRLVNEPVLFLTAWQFSEEIRKAGSEAGFEVKVLDEGDIKAEKMTGLMTVNKGSVEPPTFTVMEYNPPNAQNEQPFILVGKGVVYDTGGLSLKPTANSMDFMKSDMGGAGAVVGAMYAIAKNNLPIKVIALVPATDNRPGGNAITPGDVITMMNGKTVEVMNTDAEGRLILADALCYAERYNPSLVIDLATLTGAAVAATSRVGSPVMGNIQSELDGLKKAGFEVYERLVEFPIWEEYGEMIKSDIADINNLGSREAMSILAGKFLEHFTNYPWIHIDIAGTAYMPSSAYKYWGKNATGFGVRLLYQFFKQKVK